MARRAFDLIAFDGDDTLWHNERSYRDGREQFRRLLADAGVDLSVEEAEACVNRTELANLAYFGYGVSSFVLSLIETAIEVTNGRITGADLRRTIELAKQMLTEDIELFPAVHETLTRLSAISPLMLITKGDLLHQSSKVQRSGLRERFRFVEIVSDKTPEVYARILRGRGVAPDRFLMIGNSLRSDVLPVIEAGGWALHIPAALSWSHEHADVPRPVRRRYLEIGSLDQVPPAIERLARMSLSRRAGAASGRRRPPARSRRN
jgi:putative hydrolase of the HAD superfamily